MGLENDFMRRREEMMKRERVAARLKEFPSRAFPSLDRPGEFVESLSEVTPKKLEGAIESVKEECFEFRGVDKRIPGVTLVRFIDIYEECSVVTRIGLSPPVQFSADKKERRPGFVSLVSTLILPPVEELYGFESTELEKRGFIFQQESADKRFLVARSAPGILIQAEVPPNIRPSSQALIGEETVLRGNANKLLRALNEKDRIPLASVDQLSKEIDGKTHAPGYYFLKAEQAKGGVHNFIDFQSREDLLHPKTLEQIHGMLMLFEGLIQAYRADLIRRLVAPSPFKQKEVHLGFIGASIIDQDEMRDADLRDVFIKNLSHRKKTP